MSKPMIDRIAREVDGLTPQQQEQVLSYAKTLAGSPRKGVPGSQLLPLAGTLEREDAEAMIQAIEEAPETDLPSEISGHLDQTFSSLGISLERHRSISDEIHDGCRNLCGILKAEESSPTRQPLAGSSVLKIGQSYRFDLLVDDIERMANWIAYSIRFASLYLPKVANCTDTYSPTRADELFWYYIDFGIRLLSSSWDRVALLLDFGFQLNLQEKCSFSEAMRDIPKSDSTIIQNKDFKALKRFRDNEFRELEGGMGKGWRHETTHLLLPATRHFGEFIDATLEQHGDVLPVERAKERRDFLVKHYRLYLSGITDAVGLIRSKWPSGDE